MERLTMIPGRVVLSTQGRDEGRYFIVLKEIGRASCRERV